MIPQMENTEEVGLCRFYEMHMAMQTFCSCLRILDRSWTALRLPVTTLIESTCCLTQAKCAWQKLSNNISHHCPRIHSYMFRTFRKGYYVYWMLLLVENELHDLKPPSWRYTQAINVLQNENKKMVNGTTGDSVKITGTTNNTKTKYQVSEMQRLVTIRAEYDAKISTIQSCCK